MRKGAKHTPEVRKRMSEARKAAWADPAVRKRMSEAQKAAWAAKNDAQGAMVQRRERGGADALRKIPRDALEAALFGGGAA